MKLGSFFTGGIVPGTARANKAVVLDGSKKIDTIDITTLKINGTAVTSSAAELNAVAGAGLSAAELGVLDGVTAGTAAVGKALVPTTGIVIDTLDITTPKIATVTVLATGTEINRTCDMSTRIVDLAVSTAITEAAHDGKTIVMGGAGQARTFTLPVPVPGMKFKFVVGAVNTSNYLIKSVAGSQVFGGTIMTLSDNSAAVLGYTAGATDDTITLNGTTTGGASIGDWIEIEALTTTRWAVRGQTTSSGSEATPFSDTVT